MPEPSPPDERLPHHRVCPQCGLRIGVRTRRRNPVEYLISLAGIRPYYCQKCERRFHAFRPPTWRIRVSRHAACPTCGFTGVHAVSKERVPRQLNNFLWRILQFPSYRCPQCRTKFFSLRPRKQDRVEEP